MLGDFFAKSGKTMFQLRAILRGVFGFEDNGTYRTNINAGMALFAGKVRYLLFPVGRDNGVQSSFGKCQQRLPMGIFTNNNTLPAQDTSIGIVSQERMPFLHLCFLEPIFQVLWL